MKKLITASILGIALFSVNAMADDSGYRYQTSRHNILIEEGPNDTYIYNVWNKPKKINQGAPDLVIENGSMWGPVSAPDRDCDRGMRGYDFTLGKVMISIAMYGCGAKGQPADAS